MESACCGGGITAHLEETRRAVTRWLEHENPISTTGGGQDAALLTLATQDEQREAPEQPQVLALLREARRLNVPIFPGALMDWPHIARLELNACLDAEAEYQQIIEANLRLKAQQVVNAYGQ